MRIIIIDDAQVLPAAKQVEPRARTVLDANKDKEILDSDEQVARMMAEELYRIMRRRS